MESSSTLHSLSLRKNPRDGQMRVIQKVLSLRTGNLNCQLPTGYGKTFTAYAAYAELRRAGLVDRLLYVVPRTAQLDQILTGAKDDFADVALDGPQGIVNVGYSETAALNAHRDNTAQVFACTIQTLSTGKSTWDTTASALATARWMIVFDEYHHYGDLAAWGKKALSLRCVFRLAMSATPYRKDEDSAFGPPDISVTYREAYEERAVKRLFCHSYVYRIDAVLPDGEIKTFTTEQLIDEAGSSSPEKIDKMCVERSMRWSPKYVSPLVDIPIARMARERLDSGLPQQVLIGAMCCSHAKLVCEQVKAMFPELRIDWVGTGPYGRPPEENKKVLQKFCPEKRDGVRSPSDVKLDVLVHVGMAGEGLDSVFVTEVVHLNEANINNTNNQENGRAARVIPGLEDAQQRARINVDSTSPYAEFDGDSIMDAMDDLEKDADADDDDTDTDSERDPYERMLPDEPKIRIFDMECIRVDHGEVERLKAAYIEAAGWGKAATEDPNHFIHGKAIDLYRQFRKREAEEFNTQAIHQQWRAAVEQARSAVVGKIIKRSIVAGARFPTSLAGDIKRKLNKKALGLFGSINESSEVPTLKKHYEWYVALESEIVTRGVPTWLQ